MSRLQLLWLHVSGLLTAITGGVYAVMKYFLRTDDEFAVINHPLQPHMLAAHVVVAPILLFILGWVFSNHMVPKLRFGDGRNRASGVWAMWILIPMTLSGYLLQIATNDAIRNAMVVAHWVSSAIFAVAYVIHWVRGRAIARSDAEGA